MQPYSAHPAPALAPPRAGFVLAPPATAPLPSHKPLAFPPWTPGPYAAPYPMGAPMHPPVVYAPAPSTSPPMQPAKTARPMSVVERNRERNKIHARRSRLRKKVQLLALQIQLEGLTKVVAQLRGAVIEHLGRSFEELTAGEAVPELPAAPEGAEDFDDQGSCSSATTAEYGSGSGSATEADEEDVDQSVGTGPMRRNRRYPTPDEKLALSRERNRLHARRSRQRKRNQLEAFKASVAKAEQLKGRITKLLEDRLGPDHPLWATVPVLDTFEAIFEAEHAKHEAEEGAYTASPPLAPKAEPVAPVPALAAPQLDPRHPLAGMPPQSPVGPRSMPWYQSPPVYTPYVAPRPAASPYIAHGDAGLAYSPRPMPSVGAAYTPPTYPTYGYPPQHAVPMAVGGAPPPSSQSGVPTPALGYVAGTAPPAYPMPWSVPAPTSAAPGYVAGMAPPTYPPTWPGSEREPAA